MLNILIVDDEAPARSRMRRLLADMPGCRAVGEAASGLEALEQVKRLQPNLVLLDISMPGMDGMNLARQVRELDPAPTVVFCTAWPDQALEAFRADAVDYLVKPVSRDRLGKALEKARRISADSESTDSGEFLYATIGGSQTLIPLESVICLLSADKYTTVHHTRGQSVINDSLVELENEFPDRFLRVHRNALVTRERVRGLKKLEGGAFGVQLQDCKELPVVSRRQLPVVRKLIRKLS